MLQQAHPDGVNFFDAPIGASNASYRFTVLLAVVIRPKAEVQWETTLTIHRAKNTFR